jgi:hypothetical protein
MKILTWKRGHRPVSMAICPEGYGRDAKDFDIQVLSKATDGLTGGEIEACFVKALYAGFDQEQEPTDLTIAQVMTDFVPLSKLMAEQISALRNWAKGRARYATSLVPEQGLRRLGYQEKGIRCFNGFLFLAVR